MSINLINLERVTSFTDLAVIVSHDLTWNKHDNACISKARRTLGYVKRTLGYNVNRDVKNWCYKSLVRPLLEYGTMLWSPGI